MKNAKVFAIAVVALSSLPLVLIAQQTPASAPQQSTSTPATGVQVNDPSSPTMQSSPTGMQPNASSTDPNAVGSSAAAPVEMSSVNGELVGKLDSKSAKAGDSVVVKTVQSVKTADGTEIPKGSKLMGHVTAVQAHSQASQNSQMAIQFDHAELKGGQSLAIHSVIKSVAPPVSETASSESDMMATPTGTPGGSTMGGAHTSNPSSGAMTPNSGMTQGTAQASTNAASAAGNTPSAGTVVGKAGDVPIRTTAIPNVFLASNEFGQSAGTAPASSGTLFGAKSDIHLDGGTQMVLEVSPAIMR